ncbi:uncharacterized protein LOC131440463 [Malaya genurostris]|uniref:uncharacterized protein LOC131440463 n=1 Tax=Malaya genurostris TaxID=325434 RepID=UPI0026F3C595|nr:uncharacterized protein LOC131440463 [Malaya genurostris]XP_058467742.1 uncharacterized protein LOC131440463 [Malaya genurostris]XP_058467743.1 uncharacterized protein LOC131440463 [Malaya genurostris]
MAKPQRCAYVFLLFIVVHLTYATIPAVDNNEQSLQYSGFKQLDAANPITSSNEYSSSKLIDTDKTKTQSNVLINQDVTPALKLVTRLLDTLRSPNSGPLIQRIPQQRALPGCPLCDASVYSYCDFKVYHDGCCCGTINGIYGSGGGFGRIRRDGIGYGGCGYQEDCSFIYANSCYEHQLIVNCCCNVPF